MTKTDRVLDLRRSTVSAELPAFIQEAIEQNAGIQVNIKQLYTEIDWLNNVPSEIRKYANSTKAVLLFTVTPTWVDGVPTQILTNNHDNGIITTTTLTWDNGVPTSVTKVES